MMPMEEARDVEVDQIVARIRESVRASHGNGHPHATAEVGGLVASDPQITTDIVTLHTLFDVSRVSLESRRPFLGALRRFLARLIAPILGQQATYNAASCRLLSQVVARLDSLASHANREALTRHEEQSRTLGAEAAQREQMAVVSEQ